MGSYAEIHFADPNVRLNALSEDATETVALRDGRFLDYTLFGFPTRPMYNPNPAADPSPWILPAFGEIVKAQPPTGPIPNPCGGAQGPGPTRAPAVPVPRMRDSSAAHVPVGRPAPPAAAQVGRPQYYVQAGAFRNREYANDLGRRLRANGYTVTLVEGRLIRVRVGVLMSREAAERLAANLRGQGFEALLTPGR